MLQLILGLGAVFAIYQIIRAPKLFPSIVSIGMIAGIILVIFFPKSFLTGGLVVYMVFVFFAFLYGLVMKGLNIWSRIVICLMSTSILIYWIWRINHLDGNEILAPILAMLIGITALITKAKVKNELGFLVILAADAIAIIVERLMKIL